MPLDGSSGPRRITRGFVDTAPRFCPDGSRIGFLRSDGQSPPQLHLVNASGGEAVAVTDQKLGVGTFDWSPDGTQLAFSARVSEHGRYGTVEELASGAEPPRRIVTYKYQSNGLGYTIDRRNHIFLVDAPDPAGEPSYRTAPSAEDPTPTPARAVPEPRQLTHGDIDNGYFRFSPDGTHLAFVSARHAERDLDLANNIHLINLDSPDAEPVALTGSHGCYGISGLAFAPDGTLYFVGIDLGETGLNFVGRNGALYRLGVDNSPAVQLTDPAITDLSDGANELRVASDGNVLALNQWHGYVELVAITGEGELRRIIDSHVVVHGFDEVNGQVVVNFADAATMGDIGALRGAKLDRLTDFSLELTAAGVAPLRELTIPARDGTPIHGWVLSPSSDGRHPVLLNIHGGPYTQYTGSLFDEAQVYVDAGYAVVMCNPRGASGYGEEFGRAIRQKMGTLDYTDVLDFLDGALENNPSFDSARLGIMGGSYGGYLTAWTIAHDHRFTASIVERGFLDPEFFIGTSDIGDFFGQQYTGTDPAQRSAQSPQAFVHQVKTPTLVLHSENDLRCPLSQAERYYASLKRNGVETEMLLFPGENHELSRNGRPRHRLQRFEAILDWWQRHLPVATERGCAE